MGPKYHSYECWTVGPTTVNRSTIEYRVCTNQQMNILFDE